jgi:hypothetical protein
VTRFDLFTQAEYRVWATLKAYSAANVVEVMNATISVQKAIDHNDKIGLFVSVLKDMFVVGCIYRGWDVPPKTFGAFDNIAEVAILMPETKGTQQSLARALSITGNAKYVNHSSIFLLLTDHVAFPITGAQSAPRPL